MICGQCSRPIQPGVRCVCGSLSYYFTVPGGMLVGPVEPLTAAPLSGCNDHRP